MHIGCAATHTQIRRGQRCLASSCLKSTRWNANFFLASILACSSTRPLPSLGRTFSRVSLWQKSGTVNGGDVHAHRRGRREPLEVLTRITPYLRRTRLRGQRVGDQCTTVHGRLLLRAPPVSALLLSARIRNTMHPQTRPRPLRVALYPPRRSLPWSTVRKPHRHSQVQSTRLTRAPARSVTRQPRSRPRRRRFSWQTHLPPSVRSRSRSRSRRLAPVRRVRRRLLGIRQNR
jgi:hypothetical protein